MTLMDMALGKSVGNANPKDIEAYVQYHTKRLAPLRAAVDELDQWLKRYDATTYCSLNDLW